MRRIVIIIALLALSSCGESEGVKFRRFATYCLLAGFSQQQCLFLYSMKQDSEADTSSSFNSGLAIGLVSGSAMYSGKR
jgi:hypothetical protein